MKEIRLTHANWKKDDGAPVEIYLDASKVFAVFYMPQHKATALVAHGGGNVIVSEGVDQVRELLKQPQDKGE